jgi:hypothetical protein
VKDLISKVLSPAINLWLHSQLDQVEHLKININGTNRQIVTGYIPGVSLESSNPVYQGIHLDQVQINGENIKINLGQVIKGKPLRLLEPILVQGKVSLQQAQLNLSLASELLSTALTDLLKNFISSASWQNQEINWQTVEIKPDKLIITGMIRDLAEGITQPISLRSGLSLAGSQKLLLHPLQIETSQEQITLSNYEIDLGSQVNLETLALDEGKIYCQGKIVVVSD